MGSKKKLAKTEIKLHFLTIFFFPTYEPCWLTSTTTTVKTLFLSHSSSICHQEEETIVSFSQELRKSLVIVIKAPFTHFSQRKRNEVAHWLAFPLQWETHTAIGSRIAPKYWVWKSVENGAKIDIFWQLKSWSVKFWQFGGLIKVNKGSINGLKVGSQTQKWWLY